MSEYVRTPDGALLAVRQGGPVGAPALLLLPGQANSMRWWDGLRGQFEHAYRTVTFDYRGTGDTCAEVDDWSTAMFAEDAAHVMAELGHEGYRVYGTSMGGRVAQHLAAQERRRVEKLVLACTSPGGPLAVERSSEVRRVLASRTSPERTERVLRFFYTDDWPGRARDSLLLGDQTMTPAAGLAHLRASYGHDAWSSLPDITAPTLILHGTGDPMVPAENAELLDSAILDSRLVFHEGGRHGFFDEFADDLRPLILDFLG
ncbi:alpha/beta fold hydrolase [Mobilicoccus massiliensis]|uniref:alpha/beta fold hydrolase n=1 Tax=Mobilicoccus massiliensis TaxID=1522310 RepID=UPI00059161F9|nr:alpha/beta hydrolase [Mobilicoccus massiliensis]